MEQLRSPGCTPRENEALWREVASLRQKHAQQQKVVNKLIQFLISLVQSNRILGVKRKIPLMLNDSSSAHSMPKYSRQYSLEHVHGSSPYAPWWILVNPGESRRGLTGREAKITGDPPPVSSWRHREGGNEGKMETQARSHRSAKSLQKNLSPVSLFESVLIKPFVFAVISSSCRAGIFQALSVPGEPRCSVRAAEGRRGSQEEQNLGG
ncbi:hypothetical protein AV530_008742 [Patagioenas fasciata monilis]|uniref:Uncharacterized protein n=1 Tax=Patagioenas fasciata monilis TaxID=372326 RepID=A0A1V4JZJ1_PATFA|nr:hypothetical protein AV530_008742 [Patagioenas fasciata monilis]